mmetsp:Transcript_17195/g.49743  ORF Transcript_17195/g.49743 Transcript_17195/m.49743 type:complete len:275 (-) Transcript_17195:530-1354(-)
MLVLILLALLVHQAEDHLLDHVVHRAEWILLVDRQLLRQAGQRPRPRGLRCREQQLHGLRPRVRRQLQEARRGGLQGCRRRHGVRWGLVADLGGLREDVARGLECLDLARPQRRALLPLVRLGGARLLGVRHGLRVGLKITDVALQLVLPLDDVSVHLAEHLVLLLHRRLSRGDGLVAGLLLQVVAVDGVRLGLFRLNKVVLKVELQLLQHLDDVVGLEGVLLHVLLPVARRAQLGPRLLGRAEHLSELVARPVARGHGQQRKRLARPGRGGEV